MRNKQLFYMGLLALCCLMSACNRKEPLPEPSAEEEKAETEAALPEETPVVPTETPAKEPVPTEPAGEPGFFWTDGTLFCRDEDGALLRDTEKDGLYFSESGAYTSGSETLDALVSETLSKLMDENPDHDAEALLRDVYDFMVSDSFSYLGRRADAAEGSPWEQEAAVIMLETGMGNCHHYAAAFWALARGLGYPAITHTNPSGQRHSWTEIEIDSVRYVFDPQLAVHWKDERFMLTYDQCRQKNYTVYFSGVTAGY